jgi:DinB family protein
MHPRLTELLAYVDRETEALREAYESVPPAERNVRTDPARWSPAEIVQHLAIVDQRIVQLLGRLIDQARALPPEAEASPLLPNELLTRVVNRSRRFQTSQASEPVQTDADRVWGELMATRRALADVVASGDGLALGSVSAPHPALGNFNGYEWIMFVGAHAARHANQMLEVRQAELGSDSI